MPVRRLCAPTLRSLLRIISINVESPPGHFQTVKLIENGAFKISRKSNTATRLHPIIKLQTLIIIICPCYMSKINHRHVPPNVKLNLITKHQLKPQHCWQIPPSIDKNSYFIIIRWKPFLTTLINGLYLLLFRGDKSSTRTEYVHPTLIRRGFARTPMPLGHSLYESITYLTTCWSSLQLGQVAKFQFVFD